MNSKIRVVFDFDKSRPYLKLTLNPGDNADDCLRHLKELGSFNGLRFEFPDNDDPIIVPVETGFNKKLSNKENENNGFKHVEYLRFQALQYLNDPEDIKHAEEFFKGLGVKASLKCLNPHLAKNQ